MAKILAISGSLQTRSSNSALIQLAHQLAGADVEVFDGLADLPYFNPELDVDPPPTSVARLRQRVADADGLLIASPEYAHGMPGVLKNALDWLVSSGELYGKRVAVLCAAPSVERGAYARQWLEQTLGAQGAVVVTSATVAVAPRSSVDAQPEVARAVGAALAALVPG